MKKIELRFYQKKVIEEIRELWFAGKKRILLVLPTGAGKTFTFCYIALMVRKKKKRVYIIVHRDNLLLQTMASLKAFFIKFRLIASGYTQVDSYVQVCSVLSLARRLKTTPEPDLIVIDEAHHANAGSWRKILDFWPDTRVLGVTATPIRSDGSGLGIEAGGYFEEMVEGPTMRELIEMGNLSDYDYYLPPAGVNLAEVATGRGEYNREQLDVALRKPTITGCAVDHYMNICPDAPAIAFCVSIAHANEVAKAFKDMGVNAQSLTSEMSKEQIRAAIVALGEGRIQVLTSCDIISEGTDIPIVKTAILLRPTWSLGLFLQQCGRVLRPFPGKGNAIILDHVNNHGRHGFPDDERDWSLDAKKKKTRKGIIMDEEDKGTASRQCEECFHVHKPSPTCPKCGFIYQNNRTISQIDGTLIKISKDEVKKLKKKKAMERGRLQTHEEFVEYAKEKGYKNPTGWAYYMVNVRKKQGRYANV